LQDRSMAALRPGLRIVALPTRPASAAFQTVPTRSVRYPPQNRRRRYIG
jgi:hypothetical protein